GYFTREALLNPDGTLATKLPQGRFDPVAQWFMNQFPAPNYLDPREQDASRGGCLNLCNNFRSNFGSSQTTQGVVVKVDHQIGTKNKFFAEWLFNPTDYSHLQLPWAGPTAPLTGFNGPFPFQARNQIAAIGNTTSFSSSFMNEFRLMYSRQNNQPLSVNELLDVPATVEHLSGLNIPVSPPASPTPNIVIGAAWST